MATVYSASTATGARAFVRDLFIGARMSEIWMAFAWDETLDRYRRSVLGLAWIVCSFVFFVGMIAVFFGGFSSASTQEFLMYVAIGFAAFVFLNGNIVDGTAVFLNSAPWIKSSSLPYSIYIYKSLFRSLTPFALELVVALIGMLALGWRPTPGIIWVAPALVAYLVFAVLVQYLLGLISSRWRDIGHLIGAVSRVLFFTTPIMWTYGDARPLVQKLSQANPLTHYIAIFREPILHGTAPAENWLFICVFTLALAAVTVAVGAGMRARLPFWV